MSVPCWIVSLILEQCLSSPSSKPDPEAEHREAILTVKRLVAAAHGSGGRGSEHQTGDGDVTDASSTSTEGTISSLGGEAMNDAL